MKRQIPALILAIIITILTLPVCAVGEAGEVQTIRVGYIDYDGFIQPDADGGYTGYGAEYLAEVAQHTGWRYEYHKDTWEHCLEQLQEGKIDLLCTAQYTPERAQTYDYAKYPIGVEYGMLYVLPYNDNVYYNDYTAFNGMRVGLLKDSYQTQVFELYAQREGFTYVPVEYATDGKMMDALRSGAVDAIAAGSLARKTNLKPVAKFSIDDFYFITKKDAPEIMEPLNRALEDIKMTDPYLDARLYEKYYGDSVVATKPMFTREEAQYIKDYPVLRVACRTDWAPYEYSVEDKRCTGLSVDLLSRLSAISGWKFEYVPLKGDKIEQALNTGEVDLAATACPGVNREAVRFTAPYVSVPMQIIGTQDSMGNYQQPVLALEKSAQFMKLYLMEKYEVSEIVLCQDLKGCLDAVAKGQADIVIAGNYAVNRLIQAGRYNNLMVFQVQRDSVPLSMELSPQTPPEVRSILDKSIAFLSDGDKDRALQAVNVVLASSSDFGDFLRKYRVQIVLACTTLILVVGSTVSFLYYCQKKKYEYSTTHDTLTDCLSLQQFKKDAASILKQYGINDYYILKFDVFHLKYINQKYGTKTGDELLREIVRFAKNCCDTRNLIGRVVDDNFVMLLRGEAFEKARQDSAHDLERIKCGLKIDAPIIIKCGCYKISDPEESISSMIDKAGAALKTIKVNPKQNIMIYNDALYQQILTESQIESSMEPALADGEFHVYLQPQVDLHTMQIAAAEALIRWIRADGTAIGPDKFIPLFERNGFVEQVDFYVLKQVCGWLRKRLDAGLLTVPISVNQSRYLLSNPDYVGDVERVLHDYNIPEDMIELELTESMCLENAGVLVSTMGRLHELNMQISIDDFGSGYSSLNLLSEMPADELKIDRGFLGGSTGSAPKRQIIAKVVELAQALHIRVVCEGVETIEQEEFLKSVGCDLAQGFLYAKPMPIEEFEELLASGLPMEKQFIDDLQKN